MEITKTFVVKAPADAVWDFLIDPHRVARCLPGAAITEQVDEQTYAGTMTVKVGPVTASYRGKMRFERLDAAARRGRDRRHRPGDRGKGGADMRMTSRVVERAPGETEVTVDLGRQRHRRPGAVRPRHDPGRQRPDVPEVLADGMRGELETPAAAPPLLLRPPAALPQCDSPATARQPKPRRPLPPTLRPRRPAEERLDVGRWAPRRRPGRRPLLRRPVFWIAIARAAV